MKGDTIYYPIAVWGTQGIGDPANTPAPKYSYYHWQDSAGNFWIYSGISSGTWSGYDDVWKFDIATQNWIWIRGSTTLDADAVFGTQGIPSPDNTPGFRYLGGLSWTGKDGRFWLFSSFTENTYGDDVWVYDPATNEWTWMSGLPNNTVPHYGTMQVSSPDNTPGFVGETDASWVDDDGNLWFFGGQLPGLIDQQSLVWKYDVSTLEWTWMNGDTLANTWPVYGTLGIPSASNTPGARWCYGSWKDNEDNFWLCGGGRADMNQPDFLRWNDLWKFSTVTSEWTWVSGDSGVNNQYNAGIKCEANVAFHPSARMENRSCSQDSCGNIWMFGGMGTNYGTMDDLWVYRPAQNNWSFIAGDLILDQSSVFGVQGIPDSSNKPGGRCGAVTWFDHDGNLWLFGGLSTLYLNDLWRFTPDGNCLGSSCIPTAINGNIPQGNFSVFPNPSSGVINIQLDVTLEGSEISLYDMLGILRKQFTATSYDVVVNMEDIASGIYFLRMKKDDKQWVKKVLID